MIRFASLDGSRGIRERLRIAHGNTNQLRKEAIMPTAYEIIRDAILKKLIIKAHYEHHYREMCPHVIGWDKQGERAALFYQFGGSSSQRLGPDGTPSNWRCMKISGLTNVTSES